MFTIFHGYHLVEAYHNWKKAHRSNKNPWGLKLLKLFFAIAVPLFFWLASQGMTAELEGLLKDLSGQ